MTDKAAERKDIYIARCVLALSAAVLAAWLLFGRIGGAAGTVRLAPVQTIGEFYVDREALRRDELDRLSDIVNDAGTPEEIRLAAGRRALEVLERADREAAIEAVLAARGYEPVLVTVQSDSVNVLVQSERLERQDAAVILDLVMRECGVTGGNVKIIPVN